jgi:hypothetical protein
MHGNILPKPLEHCALKKSIDTAVDKMLPSTGFGIFIPETSTFLRLFHEIILKSLSP